MDDENGAHLIQNADAQAKRTIARLSFDPSPEGEASHNYLIKCTNALFRGMANYRRYQARKNGGWGGVSGAGPYGTQPGWSEDRGREAHERDGSEFGAHDSFGSRDGQGDRLERADVIDPDGVEQHGDLTSGIGEICENAPSEANSDETMSIVEAQGFIQVTANSGALPRLDNGAAQPEEGSTPEQGKAPGPGSESGNPKPQTPDPRDRACGGSLPATASKREQRRLRLEEERRAAERMVEEKLKAGSFSLREILTSAIALPPSDGRGP